MASTPNYQSAEWQEFAARWRKADLVLGGTYPMRASGTELLPKFPAEHPEVYVERLASATSDGDYRDTLDGLVGMVFRKPVTVGESVPAQVRQLLENIDLSRTHFDVFNQRTFRKGVHYGASYIVVDMQRLPAELDGARIDQATAETLNLRPYWILYGADQVQNAPRYVVIRGEKVLQQIVFRSCVIEPDGEFGESEAVYYKVWRLPVTELPDGTMTETGFVEWDLWEEEKTDELVGTERVIRREIVDSGTTDLRRIPVSPFVANPKEDDPFLCDGPTLEDLVELCVKDYQKQSDFEKSLHYCQAVPFTVGLKENGGEMDIAWGPGKMFDCEVGGTMGYAEPSGNAFPTWEKYLEKLKEKIRQKGLEMVMEGGAIQTTATEQVLRARKRASRLAILSEAMKDCLETAILHTARWLKLGDDAGGEITMGMSADELTLTAQDLTTLNAMVAAGNLSRLTLLENLQRAGLLLIAPPEEEQRLSDERAQSQAAQQAQPAITRQATA